MAENSEEKKKRGEGRPFKKGASGNPGGRPKKPEWLKTAFSKMQPDTVAAINDVLLHGLHRDKLAAAKLVLEYTIGKPTQAVDLSADINCLGAVKIAFEGELDDWSK